MQLIFRANASRKEKIYTVLLLVCMVLAISIFYFSFVPSALVEWLWFPTSILITFFSFRPLYKDRHPSNKIPNRPNKSMYYAAIAVFMWGMWSLLTIYFIPNAVTKLIGNDHTFVSKIESKKKERRSCHHQVLLESVGYGIRSGICVQSEVWGQLKPGDQVFLEGKKSFLGVSISSVRLNANRVAGGF